MKTKSKKLHIKKSGRDERKITAALLMAAGMGTRIRPLSDVTPKPLIPVNETPMIETMIRAVKAAGIKKIIITVGYKKEKLRRLEEKYEGIIFVENGEYKNKNTISSFYAASNLIKDENCLICESDLYVADPAIIRGSMDKSRYLLKKTKPQNHEWGFELSGGRVTKVVRPKPGVYLDHRMYGVAYWMKQDLNKLIDAVKKAYKNQSHAQKAYDEIGNYIFDEIDMGIIKVENGQIYEIDCLDDLVKVDASYAARIKQ